MTVVQSIPGAVRLLSVLAVLVALLAIAGPAVAQSAPVPPSATIAGAAVVPIGGAATVGALHGANRPAFFAVDLALAQKVQFSFDTPYAGGLTARIFRPDVTDETLSSTAPRNALSLAKGATAKTLVADWPGRWIIEVNGPEAATFTLGATQLAAGTPGRIAGSPTATMANGMVVGTTYVSTTFDPSDPQSAGARYAWVQASAGDRVQVTVQGTNGKPFSVEAFTPGTTDATSTDPVASVRSTGLASLGFDATIDGEWLVRVVAEPDAAGVSKPVTFTATLVSVTPRAPDSTCEDDVTDLGLVRVTGCITTGRGQATTTQPVAFSGVDIIPLNGSTVRIDTQTLEVSSSGTFSVDIGGMRVLTDTNYFVLKGTQTLKVPDETAIYGVPVTGSLTATWSLANGGSLAVTGTARLTSLGVEGELSFNASSDRGLQGLGIRVGVDYLHGTAFSGTLHYQRDISAGQEINVWRAGLSLAFGVAKPKWLLDKEAAAAAAAPAPVTPLSTDTTNTTQDAKGEPLPSALVGAAGSLEFRDGKLAYLQGAVNTKIPIGSTGMFVTQLGAALRWNPHFMISGQGTIALGPDVNGVSALSISGYAGWSQGGSCKGSTVAGPNWFAGGEAKIAGWFSILTLDACYQQADTPFVVVSGRSGFGIAGILTGTAQFDGYILGTQALMVEGSGELTLWGVGTEGRVVLSNAGVAACGAAYIDIFGMKRRVAVGAERRWTDAQGSFAFQCPDFAPYRTVPLARSNRAVRADGIPVAVPKGVDQVDIVVRGANGAVPGVDVIGPDGSVVAQSTSTSGPSLSGAVFAPNAGTGAMQVALPIVQAGTYLIRAQAGGSIESVQTSLPRAAVVIRARIVRRGGARVLAYTASGLDGRRVRFVDATSGSARTLGTTAKATGTFRLGTGARGRHRIEAIVLDEHGYADPARVVARYRGDR